MTTLKSKTAEERSSLDTAKLVLAFLLVAAGVVLFYWFEDVPGYYRIPALLAVIGVSAALVVATAAGRSLFGFARDARIELRKVVWPTRQETVQTTLVVLVMVFIVGIFLWLLDTFFLWAVNRLMGIGG